MDGEYCLACLEDLTNKNHYGFMICISSHYYCEECIKEFGLKCPIHSIRSREMISTRNSVTFSIDKFYFDSLKHAREKGADRVINVIESTGKYPLNVCWDCQDEVNDDEYMYAHKSFVGHHRICFDCFIQDKDDSVPSKKYAAVRLSGAERIIEIDHLFRETLRYLKEKEMNAEINVELIKHVLNITKQSLKYPTTICVNCFHTIADEICGFNTCYRGHVYCEDCATEVALSRSECPVDSSNINSIEYIRGNIVTTKIKRDSLIIGEYLKKRLKNNENATKILQSFITSDDGIFPDRVCINCLCDIVDEVYYLNNYRCSSCRFCRKCITDMSVHGRLCPVHGLNYLNITMESTDGTKSVVNQHHFKIMLSATNNDGGNDDHDSV